MPQQFPAGGLRLTGELAELARKVQCDAEGAAVTHGGAGGWTVACGPKGMGTDTARLSALWQHTVLS